MPDWLTDINKIGSISSIIGVFITVFLFIEARKIRDSFIRRARLPEVCRELAKTTSQVASHLKKWETDKMLAIESLFRVKALLENIFSRLPSDEKRKVAAYLSNSKPKKWLFLNSSLAAITEDRAWELYTELTGVVTSLQQLVKDSKWD